MEIRKVPNSTSWTVWIQPNEMMLTATKAYPYGGAIGTINGRGTLHVYTPAVGRPRDWKKIVTYKLEDARQKLYDRGDLINKKVIKARREEKKTGSFLVRVVIPTARHGKRLVGQSKFHSMPPAMKWADEALKNRPAGSRAEFYRTLPEGSTYKAEGSPWTEPFHVHAIDEYGHIRMGSLREGDPDPAKSSDHESSYSTFGKGKLRRQIGVIGNAMWRLPAPSPYVIYWNGPGGRLLFGTNKPGSQLSPIEHPSADGSYRSLKEAQAAVTRFWKSKS